MGVRRILLLTAAAGIVALAGAALAQQGGGRSFESKAFTHRPHLNKASQEECALCHKGEAAAKPEGEKSFADFSQCATCHAKEKSIQVTLAPVKGKARFPRFYHDKHTSVACAACHEYDRARDAFSAPKDHKVCATCHGAHDGKRPYYAGDGKCSACHMQGKIALLRPEQKGVFSHRLHLPSERPATKEDCLHCHAGAKTAKDLAEATLGGARAEACRGCHIPSEAGGAPASLEVKAERVERFFTEFPHGAHTAKLDCAACHALGKDDRYAFTDAVGKLPAYEGCVSCHEHQGWAVKDHGKPIQCARCHEEGKATIRVATFAKQARLGPLSFGEVQHPFLGERDMSESCGKCHYRARETVLSGIEGKPFSHRSHATETCESCHGAIARSSSPEDSRKIDVEKACAGCHKGYRPQVSEALADPVSSPPFSHASHLAAVGKRPALAKGCVACHVLDLAKDVVGTPADVATCRRCHDHKTHADVTGQDLDRCIKCHTGQSLYRALAKVAMDVAHVVRATNPHQKHDMGGECQRCHATAPVAVERPGATKVVHKNDAHVGLALDSCNKCHVVPKGF